MSFARRADPDEQSGRGERKPDAAGERMISDRARGEPSPGEASGGPVEPNVAAPEAALVFIPRITIAAFVRDPKVREALAAAHADRRMVRATLDITEGGLESASERYQDQPAPDLLIVETRRDREELFAGLERLAEQCPPGTRLIVIGRDNDVALYRQLLRFGVGEYLVAPVTPIAVISAVAQLFQEEGAERLGRVVAFIGARGGAGSSTTAQNVAAAMAGLQASVLLIDLDLRFGTAALDLNMEPAQGVGDALAESERLDETLLDRLAASRGERFGLLAAPCQLDTPDEYHPEAIARLVDTARAVAPNVLLDLPHGWSASNRRALLSADEIVLTATPDLSALRNARNIIGALRAERANDPAPRLVLNKIGVPKRREISPDDFKRVLELEPTAMIPHDPLSFSAAAASGEPVAETRKCAAAADGFDSLARLLTGQKSGQAARDRRSVFARLFRAG